MQDMSYDNQGYSSNNPGNPYGESGADQQGWGADQPAYPADQGSGAPTGSQGSASYPSSHSSAGYPMSQGSAGYPGGQAAAGYPTSQGSAGYPTTQASSGYAGAQDQGYAGHDQGYAGAQGSTPYPQQQGGYAGQPGWDQGQPQPPAQWAGPQGPSDDNPFAALVDFSFTKMATPGLVKILYIAAAALGVLQILGFMVTMISMGDSFFGFGGILVVFGLIGGLIGLFVFVLTLRVYLELALSIVRTAKDVREIRTKIESES